MYSCVAFGFIRFSSSFSAQQAHGMAKRHSDFSTQELERLLRSAKKKVLELEDEIIKREVPLCVHEFEKKLPSGRRDNGEYHYICARCGRVK